MLLRVRHVHQSGPLSYIVKYDAEVEVTLDDLRVAVDVLSTVPDDADPALVAKAADAVRRGAESVLHPRRAGAIMRLRGLCIHDVDFAPRKFERHTAEDLSQALDADA